MGAVTKNQRVIHECVLTAIPQRVSDGLGINVDVEKVG